MNWNDVKKIIRKEVLKEATTVNAGNTKFNLRTGVNKNPTKLGLKIQFEPLAVGLEPDTKSKLEVALQEKLNTSLQEYDIQVSKDTDVPRPEVIGFFIPLAQLKNLIVKSLTGQKVDAPDVKAPEPEGNELNEQLLQEMRVRDLNEISRVVKKDDFYEFINKGNNILRDLENAGNTKFNLRTGVNKNPTKLGLKIQFEPLGDGLESDVKSKLEVALQEKLNVSLQQYDIQVSKDTDVPRPEVIGFFIPLAQLKNLIVKSLTGQKVDAPDVKAPEPEGEELNEQLLKEMRVRDLNEISKVVKKDDFYEFINKGNNILRDLEDAGMSNGKKYLMYLVKHNIM